jgi:hypothetical protein
MPKERAEIKRHSVSQYIKGTCRQFQTICTTGGKGAKLIIDPRSHENIVSKEAVRKSSWGLRQRDILLHIGWNGS